MPFFKLASDIVLVPVFQRDQLASLRKSFDANVKTFPEFYHPPANSTIKYPYVPGSFGAFRNPSNFHCPFARTMRSLIHCHAMLAIGEKGKYFTQLFDSMSLRYAGLEFKGESWHRDSHPMPGKIWQGWVNLDDEPQHFRCVPNSALQTGQGFGAEQEPPAELQETIEIPPGNMILFRQDILHCILKSKKGYDSYRQYVGFRISDAPNTIYDPIHIINEQSCPLLPSGEIPAMFSKNHDSALLYSHTIPWSECIVQDFVKKPRVVGGAEILMCPRHISEGLTSYGKAYQAYTEMERLLMMPELI